MKMLDSKSSSEGGSYNSNQGSYNQNYNQIPQNQYNNQNSYDNFGGAASPQKQKFEQRVPEIDIEDDEIPF